MFRRWWWVFLVMAGIGAAGGVIVAGIVTYLMPKGYDSQAVIEVRPAHGEMNRPPVAGLNANDGTRLPRMKRITRIEEVLYVMS